MGEGAGKGHGEVFEGGSVPEEEGECEEDEAWQEEVFGCDGSWRDPASGKEGEGARGSSEQRDCFFFFHYQAVGL